MLDAFSAAGSLVHRPWGPRKSAQAAVRADAGAGEDDDPPRARPASRGPPRGAPRRQATFLLTMT